MQLSKKEKDLVAPEDEGEAGVAPPENYLIW
jgi:hypothetical protein